MFSDLISSSQLPESDIAPFFELYSLLLGNGTLDDATQLSHLQSLMIPVLNSTQLILQSPNMLSEPGTSGDLLTIKLNFLAMSTKGTIRPVAHLQAPYEQCLTVAVEVLSTLPRHNALRCKFMIVLHRMVICLQPETFLRFMPQVMSLLVGVWKECDYDDFESHVDMLVPLLNQLMIRFEGNLFTLLDTWLYPILHLMSNMWTHQPTDVATSDIQVPSLQAQYFSLIHHVVQHKLSSVLSSQMVHLEGVLSIVALGVEEHEDPVIKKRCLGIIRALIKCWWKEDRNALPDSSYLLNYLLERVVPAVFRCIYSSHFKPKDANSSRVLTEVSKLLCEVYEGCGTHFTQQLTSVILPRLNFSPELIHRVGSVFRGDGVNPQAVEKVLKEFLSCSNT